jgi:hypothetical protein
MGHHFCPSSNIFPLMAVASDPQREKTRRDAGDPWWSPYFWSGMNITGWFRLLARNRFAVDWRHWHVALAITCSALFNSLWSWVQWVQYSWRVPGTKINQEPIFILGHWRAGTTLLHELMVLDERHTSPSTYACLAPNHFLDSEDFAHRFLNFLMPAHRPMDNMPTGWARPQEDEFALCNLGVPSPYLTIAFPNHPPQHPEYLTMKQVPPAERERWKRALFKFLQQITFRTPKRIVLKSPPHTARIEILLEIFPDARFVHIVRDPYVVFASTVNLWKKLYPRHGLQTPRFVGVEEYVFDTFERMYDAFEQDRALIPPSRLCEVRYEELVRDPLGGLRQVYEQLELDGFEQVLPAVEEYLSTMEGYQTNRYQMPPELRERVSKRWARFIQQYGYGDNPTLLPPGEGGGAAAG